MFPLMDFMYVTRVDAPVIPYIPFVLALAFRRNVVTLALENQIPLSKMAIVLVLLSIAVASSASAMTPGDLRVTNLPDFVGFSYSRASPSPPSNRFIHFLNEVS